MKNKPITCNELHINHLGFPASKSWKNVRKETYLSLTCPSFMFLERANSKDKGLGERTFISSFPRPHRTLISGTASKPTACVAHLEKTGWLQSLSSGPAGISSWFSQRKSTLLLARDHASLGNKPRYEYPQGKESIVLTIHRVSIFQS